MAYTFKHFPVGSNIRTGSHIFKHYGDELSELCFTANTAGSTIKLSKLGSPSFTPVLEYSTNKTSWNSYTINTIITLTNIGDKVYFRGDNSTINSTDIWNTSGTFANGYYFVMTGSIAGSGNVMSLLDKTCQSVTLTTKDSLACLFRNCISLTTAPDFPATTLTESCYNETFNGCTSLTTAPALPATTLATQCYLAMFLGCTKLTTAPALPATTLAAYCYYCMFDTCTSLTTVPALPATTLAEDCYYAMFADCTALQVYSSTGTGHDKAWSIPTSGTASSNTRQEYMFYGTTGSYSTSTRVTLNKTFYTQNTPV